MQGRQAPEPLSAERLRPAPLRHASGHLPSSVTSYLCASDSSRTPLPSPNDLQWCFAGASHVAVRRLWCGRWVGRRALNSQTTSTYFSTFAGAPFQHLQGRHFQHLQGRQAPLQMLEHMLMLFAPANVETTCSTVIVHLSKHPRAGSEHDRASVPWGGP